MNPRLILVTALALVAAPVLAGCAENGGNGGGTAGVLTTCGAGGASESTLVASAAAGAPAAAQNDVMKLASSVQQPLGEQLKLGTLLPLSGSLEAFGPSMQRGTDLAVKQINDAGGVNGQPVVIVHEDSRTDKTQAPNAFNNLVNQGVAGVVGAASSTVTASVLPLAVSNNVLLLTPASTNPTLTTENENNGFFYRVPPSDALQGRVLADLVYDDGCRSAAILAENGAYGVGLANVFQESFEGKGGTVTQLVKYETGGTTFASQVQQAGNGNPDAIVVIGYPTEGSQIVKEAYQKGVMSDSVFFFSEGLKDPKFVELVGNASGSPILAGLQGTTPSTPEGNQARQAFEDAYQAEYGEAPGLFAAESYDAVWAMALAAQASGAATGAGMKESIREVYNKPGTDVSGANPAVALTTAKAGTDINYVGASGDFDWDENGDPTSGFYAYWKVGADGAITQTQDGIQPS